MPATSEANTTPAGGGDLSPTDLAELIGAFNDVTVKLQSTHESLRGEVSRLQGELTQVNRQLERAQRLAALGEMAAGIAHEVRNPLGSIRLHARLLEQDLADRPGERGVTRKILAAVEGLDAVVSDVLAFSKEFRVRPGVCDASEVLERALDECMAMEHARRMGGGRELPALLVRREDLGRGEGVVFECDQTLVHRALVNVVRNAIQAMTPEAHERRWTPSKRELTLDAREEEVPTAEGWARGMVVLSVADTGPGMTKEILERMFNPFFTTRAAGTGLGLAIVHRIADAHRGLVRVRNRDDGAGAVVEVVLPRRAAADDGNTAHSCGTEAARFSIGVGEKVEQPIPATEFAALTEQA